MSTPRPVTPLGILAERLDAIAARLGGEEGVPGWLEEELGVARALAGGLDDYVARVSTPPSAELDRVATATAAHDWAAQDAGTGLEQEMLSGHVEGQVLKMLVAATRARRVLEVGMFTGYSALAMAEALPDGGDAEVVACEVDAAVAALAREWFGDAAAGRRVRVEVGPAADTLTRLAAAGEVFDLAFVDADKPGYAGYVDTLLDTGLLAPHGLLAVDNTLLQGQPWLPGERSRPGRAIAEFNERLAADPRVEQVLVPLRDGLTLARRVDQ